MTLQIANNLIDEIKNMLKDKYENLTCVFGIIDDIGLSIIYDYIPKNANIFISVDSHFTTSLLLNKLLNFNNVYFKNNNNSLKIEQTNIIFGIKENKIKLLFLGTNFIGYNLENNTSLSLVLEGDIKELSSLIDKFNSNEYEKLNVKIIKELDDNFELRNKKAGSLSDEMNLDEIKMSFRKINEVDNKEEFIDKVKKQNSINVNKDDIIIENISNPNNTSSNKKDLIDFDIDIDLGE